MKQYELETVDLAFGYGGTSLFRGWNSRFESSEFVAVTGPSGSGKSTLLYLLGLMVKPRSGEILFEGEPTTRLSDSGRARIRGQKFGFVFQDALLDATRTVLDNVIESAIYRSASLEAARIEAQLLMKQFGVELRAHAKPSQVSGGQAQRIALCRALLGSPPVVLADEPTGNLDTASRDVVIEALKQHARAGATVIIVTHDPWVAEQCDRTIRLE